MHRRIQLRSANKNGLLGGCGLMLIIDDALGLSLAWFDGGGFVDVLLQFTSRLGEIGFAILALLIETYCLCLRDLYKKYSSVVALS